MAGTELPPALPSSAPESQMIETMKRMHQQKVKGLLNSLHMMKQQLTLYKAASKEHRRSALIQQLRKGARTYDFDPENRWERPRPGGRARARRR